MEYKNYDDLSDVFQNNTSNYNSQMSFLPTIAKLAEGSQSKVFDTSKFIMKSSSTAEFKYLDDLVQVPIESLRIYNPKIINGELNYFQSKVESKPTMDKIEFLLTLTSELTLLETNGLAHNDVCFDNVVSGHLIDSGLLCRINRPLHKLRKVILSNGGSSNSSTLNDVIGLKIIAKAMGLILLSNNYVAIKEEISSHWTMKVNKVLKFQMIMIIIGYIILTGVSSIFLSDVIENSTNHTLSGGSETIIFKELSSGNNWDQLNDALFISGWPEVILLISIMVTILLMMLNKLINRISWISLDVH